MRPSLFGGFDGPGIRTTGRFFQQGGYPAGATMALVAGLTETLAGLGLVLGLLTPLAGAAIVGVMINAITVKWAGDVIGRQGVEFESPIPAAAAALAITGPGRFALDHFVPGLCDDRLVYGVAALVLAVALAVLLLLPRD